MKAKRYNKKKNRIGLIPHQVIEELAKVYTIGAHKYSVYKDANGNTVHGSDIPFSEMDKYTLVEDCSDNWRLGSRWTDVMDSVKRHIAAWERGEDYDKELGVTMHLAHAIWGCASLITYYQTYPQGDNRITWYRKPLKSVWLDIDGIVADYETAYKKKYSIPEHITANDWHDPMFNDVPAADDVDFWMSCQPACKPEDISYPIAGYCTSRDCPNSVTEEWLSLHRFPKLPVVQTKNKLDSMKNVGCDVFLDDNIKTFIELNSNGVLCYLMSRPHNEKYNVGHLRVHSVSDFMKLLKSSG